MIVAVAIVIAVGPLLWVIGEPVLDVVVPVPVRVNSSEGYLYALDVISCLELDTVTLYCASVVRPGHWHHA